KYTFGCNVDVTANLLKKIQYFGKNVERAVFISTDKVAQPENVYARSKQTAEKLWLNPNLHTEKGKYVVCRLGNVLGSTGSVLTYWDEDWRRNKCLRVTNPDMRRFIFSYQDALNLIDVASK